MSKFIPSSKGAKFISDEFFRIVNSRKNVVVNFEEDKAPGDCGMVACHGGWATEFDGFEEWMRNHGGGYVYYRDGADYLAYLMGFDDLAAFWIWAYKNPKLWGYQHGDSMFGGSGYRAFGFTHKNKHKCTLEFIAKWYADFSERLKRAEK